MHAGVISGGPRIAQPLDESLAEACRLGHTKEDHCWISLLLPHGHSRKSAVQSVAKIGQQHELDLFDKPELERLSNNSNFVEVPCWASICCCD
jgi:hypothetical protein